ncbi:MAG: polysaccharide deacetylase family protein [Bdellovibrionales bacterium]
MHAFQNDSKAVILTYYRIGEPQHQRTNISIEQFDEHLNEITNGDYNILPLSKVVTALKNSEPLPPRTIAITFENAYRSAYNHAIKKLIKRDIPFTVFVASENTQIPSHLDWKTLNKIAKFKHAEFGILPSTYKHIAYLSKQDTTRSINKSRKRFNDNMGFETNIFSYPYGETSNTLLEILEEQDFKAAFSLHSGPAHSQTSPLQYPRFTMTGHYADIDRFRMITNTLPLTIRDVEPDNWMLKEPLKQIGFTVSKNLEENLNALSCFISNQEKPIIEIIENRVEIIPREAITDSKTRLNCTMPSHINSDNKEQWHWLGMLFHSQN